MEGLRLLDEANRDAEEPVTSVAGQIGNRQSTIVIPCLPPSSSPSPTPPSTATARTSPVRPSPIVSKSTVSKCAAAPSFPTNPRKSRTPCSTPVPRRPRRHHRWHRHRPARHHSRSYSRVCERLIEGIPERMRAEGLKHTPLAPLSRAVCGTRGSTLILNLPGSPKGAVESLEAVIELLPHMIDLLHGKTGHGEASSA